MCSSIINVVFTIVLVIAILLTLIALATPGWQHIDVAGASLDHGLFGQCGGSASACASEVEKMFENKETWEQAAIAFLVLGFLLELAALAWSFILCFMCCCKSCLTKPLIIFCGVATLFLVIGIAIYGVKSKEQFDLVDEAKKIESLGTVIDKANPIGAEADFGYSMWMAIIATLLMAVCTILAILMDCVSKVSPV